MKKTVTVLSLLLITILLAPTTNAQWVQNTGSGLPTSWNLGYALDVADSNHIVFSANSGVLYYSNDGGDSWRTIGLPSLLRYAEDVELISNGKIIVAGDSVIAVTSDLGANWSEFYFSGKTEFFNYVEMFDDENGIAMGDSYNQTASTLFVKTEDGGETWTEIENDMTGFLSGDMWRRIDFVNPTCGYFRTSGGSGQSLYKTTDGGENWSNLEVGANLFSLKFYDEEFGMGAHLTSDENTRIIRTDDGGVTWDTVVVEAEGWSNDIEFTPGNPSKVWYTDYRSLFVSSDSGKTWIESTIPDWGCRDIEFADNVHGWILGDGGLLLCTKNAGQLATDIDVIDYKIPTRYTLTQNYPNPFNPSTQIKYSISEAGHVTLKVFDILGRQVAALVNTQQAAGTYQVTFNAEEYGNLASGVYMYQLTSGDFAEAKKFVLSK